MVMPTAITNRINATWMHCAKDPHYYHALKGIAWLAFSHDKDVANARKIIAYLQQRHPVPDYELLLSQMAAVEQDSAYSINNT